MRGRNRPLTRFLAAVMGVFCGVVAVTCGMLFAAARDPRVALVGVAGAIGAYSFLHFALTGRDAESTVLWP